LKKKTQFEGSLFHFIFLLLLLQAKFSALGDPEKNRKQCKLVQRKFFGRKNNQKVAIV
jgi:hypothetical protein